MNANRYKKFTILHSNDMHGDFFPKTQGLDGRQVGGLALLSSYLNRVRKEEKNVIYLNAGDMVQGSMIDAEYKGLSTIELMNYLAPDVATLGNHELDYGLRHLLFMEKIANFPIVNTNLYIQKYHKRIMRPYLILNVDGLDILFIGVITQTILQQIKTESDISTFVGLEDAVAEVGKICNAYKDDDIDLTILLTHIGYDEDKKFAAMLDPEWGVDLIIGGHSHTVIEQPAQINNILIAQAGSGTGQIGRFDIVVDDDTNGIVEWQWQLVPIDSTHLEPDKELEQFISSFQDVVDRKYNTIICRLARKLTHPRRDVETEIGNLFADILVERAQVDVMLVGSGNIRHTELGPLVTLGDLKGIFPYNEPLIKFTITGQQLSKLFTHIMRAENRIPGQGECFQINHGVKAVYNERERRLESLTINGQALNADQPYTICMEGFHYTSSLENIGLTKEELTALKSAIIVATSSTDILEEHLGHHQRTHNQIEGRMEYLA